MNIRNCIVLIAIILAPALASAQQLSEQLVDALNSQPGAERSVRMAAIAAQERLLGNGTAALELAAVSAQEAERSGSRTMYAEALLTLAQAHRSKGNNEQAIAIANKAALIALSVSDPLHAQALLDMADHYRSLGFPQRSLELLAELSDTGTLSDAERTRASIMKASALSQDHNAQQAIALLTAERNATAIEEREARSALDTELARLLAGTGQYAEACAFEQEAMTLAIALGRPLEAATAANNWGVLLHRIKRTDQALQVFTHAEMLAEGDADRTARIRMNKALALADAGQAEAGLRLAIQEEQAGKALPMATQMLLLRTESALALWIGDPRRAQETALKALHLAEGMTDLLAQREACDILVQVYEQRDMPVDAKVYERRSRELDQQLSEQAKRTEAEQKTLLLHLNRAEREQAEVFNREKQQALELERLALDGANRENRLALALTEKELEESAKREALLAGERARQTLQLTQAILEAERRDGTIRELDAERMIQTLNLAKGESERNAQRRAMEVLEQRSALASASQQRDRIVKLLSMAMALLAGASAIWLAWAWTTARKKKRTIWRQHQHIIRINEELEKKSCDIQSSLNYARTIQAAILPVQSDLDRVTPDSFIFYKPLDVVSGDLPFVKRIGERSYVAAIDCTGHGVPAAMMTFIAYYGMSEILNTHPSATAGEVLDLLHEHVHSTMDARGEHALYNDGFDIGLCILDHSTGDLTFAGAQLPLIVLRDGKAERIKGDVLPLGDKHFDRNSGYRTHIVTLKPNDCVFLSSDGIIHQMNGTDPRRKFSMKRLMEVIEHTPNDDMAQMKQRTESLFDEWKDGTTQTDDVLLIGMRYAA